MTEMEEFVALLKYTAKSYLIFLLAGTASATPQPPSNRPPKPVEPVEQGEVSTPYIQ